MLVSSSQGSSKWLKISAGLLFVIIFSASRWVPHASNFTPVLAMALFAGFFTKRIVNSLILVLGALLLSDIALGFHDQMFLVYISLAATVGMGFWLKKHNSLANKVVMLVGSSILFFALTNAGVWWASGMYPRTVMGLWECFVMAIPFFDNTLISALLFGVLIMAAEAAYLKFSQRRTSVLE